MGESEAESSKLKAERLKMENVFDKKPQEYIRCSVDWDKIDHFEPDEFDDPTEPGSWKHMDPMTVLELNSLRKRAGIKIVTHNKFGLRGCVCMLPEGHSDGSRHYVQNACDAVDFHFETDADPRDQVFFILHKTGFTGIGIYYDWMWEGEPLAIGFHVDRRKHKQIWRRDKNEYFYLLK